MDKNQQLELLSGVLIHVLAKALGDAFKELRSAAPERCQEVYEAIEQSAVINLKNSPLDAVPDEIQLHVIQNAEKMLAIIFRDARTA